MAGADLAAVMAEASSPSPAALLLPYSACRLAKVWLAKRLLLTGTGVADGESGVVRVVGLFAPPATKLD